MWFIIGITQPISIFVIRFFLLIPHLCATVSTYTHIYCTYCVTVWRYMVSLRSIGIETAAFRQLNAVFIMITIINSNSICGRIWVYTHKFAFGFSGHFMAAIADDFYCHLRIERKASYVICWLCCVMVSNRNRNLGGENHEKYAEFVVEISHHKFGKPKTMMQQLLLLILL